MRLTELKEHLYSLPGSEWIYRTTYYEESWGFCLCENHLARFDHDQEYDVCIDSSLEDGYQAYGECLLPGEEAAEVLISCHLCHPSLANDNLSGIAVAVELARYLAKSSHRYSYRFVFYTRNDRFDHLAGSERRSDSEDSPRNGVDLPW